MPSVLKVLIETGWWAEFEYSPTKPFSKPTLTVLVVWARAFSGKITKASSANADARFCKEFVLKKSGSLETSILSIAFTKKFNIWLFPVNHIRFLIL